MDEAYLNRDAAQGHSDSETYSIEEESAKLQAEAQKVSRELEEILGTNRSSEPVDVYEEEDSDLREDSGGGSFERQGQEQAPFSTELPQEAAASTFTPNRRSEEKSVSDSPGAAPNWRKLNSLLNQFGFPSIPIRMSENLDLIPDYNALSEVLLKVLSEYERKKPSLDQENLSSTQRLITELNSLRADKGSLVEENGKLKLRFENERMQMTEKRKELETMVKELERQNKVLKNKLETAYMQMKQRDQTVGELKAQLTELNRGSPLDVKTVQDREKAIFRRFFNREPSSGTVSDSKVLSLISLYEEAKSKTGNSSRTSDPAPPDIEERHKELLAQFQKLAREKSMLESQRKILHDENEVLKTELQERPTSRQLANLHAQLSEYESRGRPSQDSDELLTQVLGILDLKDPRQLPSAIGKMQQVIRAIPNLEGFIKAVSAEVFSSNTAEDDRKLGSRMDDVIPTLRAWKHKLGYYETMVVFRNKLCETLNLDPSPNTADFDIVSGDSAQSHKESPWRVQRVAVLQKPV